MKSRKSKNRVPVAWQQALQLWWPRFDLDRCSDVPKTLHLMVESFVNCSVAGGSSNRDSVEEIARTASIPINIESLAEALAKPIRVRGGVRFGRLGDELDNIATNYPNMYWWMSDKGLNMAIVDPNHVLPDPFEELAGALMIQHWKDGRLSKESLSEIATELDKNRFFLKDNLQPNEWAAIAEHNQKHSRAAIKTFVQAVRNPRFSRFIRRRLYRARYKRNLTRSPHLSMLETGLYA
jgi:hypothetical protein